MNNVCDCWFYFCLQLSAGVHICSKRNVAERKCSRCKYILCLVFQTFQNYALLSFDLWQRSSKCVIAHDKKMLCFSSRLLLQLRPSPPSNWSNCPQVKYELLNITCLSSCCWFFESTAASSQESSPWTQAMQERLGTDSPWWRTLSSSLSQPGVCRISGGTRSDHKMICLKKIKVFPFLEFSLCMSLRFSTLSLGLKLP